jgi:hypothetical protein
MEPKQKTTITAVGVIALTGLLAFCFYAMAGNLEPSAPPGPTMKTLDQIYDAISSTSPSISQREGYCRFHSCSPGNTTILTVPMGQRFVLRKLWVYHSAEYWTISGGPNCYIDASILYTRDTGARDLMWDFPDGCVVVEGGNSLTFNNSDVSPIKSNVVGYFYDVP